MKEQAIAIRNFSRMHSSSPHWINHLADKPLTDKTLADKPLEDKPLADKPLAVKF